LYGTILRNLLGVASSGWTDVIVVHQPVEPPLVAFHCHTSTIDVVSGRKMQPRPVMVAGCSGLDEGSRGKFGRPRGYIQGGQQHENLSRCTRLVANLIAVVKQTPSINLLDDGRCFKRSRSVFPHVNRKIHPGAVVHRANVNFRFALAIKIAALVGVRENGWMFRQARSDVSPSRIGASALLMR